MLRNLTLAITLLMCLSAGPAWAVQAHGGAEGLVSHQLAHLLLIVGMAYLLFPLHRLKLKKKGWCEFRVFLWLLILWNLLTFAGHWLNELISADKFIRISGKISAFRIENFSDGMFYLSRLDHFLLLPALLCLLLALRRWSRLS